MALLLEKVTCSIGEHLWGYHADNLRSSDLDAMQTGATTNLFVSTVEWRDMEISDVHGHLGNAVFLDIPSNGFDTAEGARMPYAINLSSFLTNVAGYGVGNGYRCGVKIKVDGDEKVACPNYGTASLCGTTEIGRHEVGLSFFCREFVV